MGHQVPNDERFNGEPSVEAVDGVRTHGAQVVISYMGTSEGFYHRTGWRYTKPRVEIFGNGVLVGCTFVYGNALKAIAAEYAKFVSSQSKVIQP